MSLFVPPQRPAPHQSPYLLLYPIARYRVDLNLLSIAVIDTLYDLGDAHDVS